mmetsp:Transcript_58105/g.173406  ORF Transcript_58105/g.173406 Transcript_58105/m.173406 type:complete len:238 (-) Transcript_58105:232-945(-)
MNLLLLLLSWRVVVIAANSEPNVANYASPTTLPTPQRGLRASGTPHTATRHQAKRFLLEDWERNDNDGSTPLEDWELNDNDNEDTPLEDRENNEHNSTPLEEWKRNENDLLPFLEDWQLNETNDASASVSPQDDRGRNVFLRGGQSPTPAGAPRARARASPPWYGDKTPVVASFSNDVAHEAIVAAADGDVLEMDLDPSPPGDDGTWSIVALVGSDGMDALIELEGVSVRALDGERL